MTPSRPVKPLRKGYLELAVQRLSAGAFLSESEKDAVRSLNGPRQIFAKGASLVDNDAPGFHFVLDGWGCQMRVVSGHRQIFSMILPGDVVGQLPGQSGRADFECVALTKVTTIDATALTELGADGIQAHAGIAQALAQFRRRAETRMYDHLVRLGSRKAYESVSHLFLELYARQREVGMTSGFRFFFPAGQESLGDLLGISEVHVNRTLTRLREDGHVTAGPGWFALPRLWELAASIGYPADATWPASDSENETHR